MVRSDDLWHLYHSSMWRQANRARATIALGAGLVLLAVMLVVTMSGSPMVIVSANSTLSNGSLAASTSGARACQADEVLPASASAIRLTLTAQLGPPVTVEALSGARLLTGGARGSGWTGGSVTVRVRPVTHTVSHVRICFKIAPSKEAVGMVGSPTGPAVAARSGRGEALPGRIKIEYLRAGESSWWSVAPEVARRIGLGHAPSGSWVVLSVIGLMGAVIATASWLTLKELRSDLDASESPETPR